jgi:D-cysteine desulfhydrase family pyridoxal phosphate-dependent enzyme
MLDTLPRYPLAHLPTPLEPLERLSDELGGRAELWVKRDDCTGLALGGNKVRKLEYIVAGALERKADTLVTVGAAQSNHVRLTAAAAARAGLRCTAVLFAQEGIADGGAGGNVILDHLLGAEIRETPFTMADSSAERMEAFLEEVLEELRGAGRIPEMIPAGGATAEGALGYAMAVPELMEQARRAELVLDTLVCAVGTGGTLAGLLVGAAATGCCAEMIGFRVLSEEDARSAGWAAVGELAQVAARRAGVTLEGRAPAWRISDRAIGPGYGLVDEATARAVSLAARAEGLVLDPVYSGKAMAGLIEEVRDGRHDGKAVLFLHTGGAPALFVHPEVLALG